MTSIFTSLSTIKILRTIEKNKWEGKNWIKANVKSKNHLNSSEDLQLESNAICQVVEPSCP